MNSDITKAFFDLIIAANLGIPVSFEGIKFEQPASGQWLELSILPNDGIDQSLAGNNVLAQGIFQVNVCDRPNTGLIPLQQLSETVAALFNKNTLVSGLVRVARKPYTSSALSLDDKLVIPLTIEYSA